MSVSLDRATVVVIMAAHLETPWKRLRWARLAAGIPARELDRLAKLAEGHTALLEAGKKQGMDTRTAGKLARALGISLDWFVLGDGGLPSEEQIRASVQSARAPNSGAAA